MVGTLLRHAWFLRHPRAMVTAAVHVPALATTESRLRFRHGPRISSGRAGLVRGIGKSSMWPVACGSRFVLFRRRGGSMCPPELRGDVSTPVAIVNEAKLPPLRGGLEWGFWIGQVACGSRPVGTLCRAFACDELDSNFLPRTMHCLILQSKPEMFRQTAL